MRSFLTMLGIIIGVASVIILVSLVNAYMSYMTESFASLGTNQISVNMINLSSRSVSVDEMYEFYEEHTDLFDHMTPMVSVSTTVKTIWRSRIMIWSRDGTSSIQILRPDRRSVSSAIMWPASCMEVRRRRLTRRSRSADMHTGWSA